MPVKLFKILIACFIFCNLQAQEKGTKLIQNVQSNGALGKVRIVQNHKIIDLIDNHLADEGRKKGIMGYRISIYSNSGSGARESAERTLAKFMNSYPGIKTYFSFSYPDYKIYVGDFRTRTEVLSYQKLIEKEFPNAFFVQTRITPGQ